MELSEKIEAALVSYLSGQTWPADFTAASQILAGESATDLTDQVIVCAVQPGREENPQFTGNFLVPVRVSLLTPVAVQTDETSSQLAKHSATAAVLENAILVDDLPGQLNTASTNLGNADIKYDFDVLVVQGARSGLRPSIFMFGGDRETFDFFDPERLSAHLEEAGFSLIRTVETFGRPPQGYIYVAGA